MDTIFGSIEKMINVKWSPIVALLVIAILMTVVLKTNIETMSDIAFYMTYFTWLLSTISSALLVLTKLMNRIIDAAFAVYDKLVD